MPHLPSPPNDASPAAAPTRAQPIDDDPMALLKRHFGFDTFRPGQLGVVRQLFAGRSAAAVFPTGGGKSLCYQLPAVALPGLTLVVSPLIALMKDQIDALTRRNIRAARLDSSLDADEYRAVMDALRDGSLRLLYVAPERFANERFREQVARLDLSLFAVDEAHCISEWGHNFRPDYLKLARFAKDAGAKRVLALTATATPAVLEDITSAFDIAPDAAVRTGFYRPNLDLCFTPVGADERDALLIDRLTTRPAGPTIVYVTLQRTAEEVAERLSKRGVDARAYHAGMKPEDRSATQDWFIHSDAGVVVATIAFGMGIDKADIRYVYHYNLPKSLENYAQEIGRAGRDGEQATCETLACLDDRRTLENFVHGDTPAPRSVRDLVRDVLANEGDFDLSLYELSAQHDMRPLVIRTLLTYLELDRLVEGGTPFYSSYRFRPLMPSGELLDRFVGERRGFVAGVLRCARKAKTWFDLDVDRAASATGSDRQRVIAALDYLGEQGMLEVRAAGLRYRYRRRDRPADAKAVGDELAGRIQQRERAELGRLQQVIALAHQSTCQTRTLGEHFGESIKPCGHCSACRGEGAAGAGGTATVRGDDAAIDESLWQQALSLRDVNRPTLDDPHALARLLCGVTSPALSRAKLTKHELFGALSGVPFQAILERAGDGA